jgi:NADH-quinone oxidoreductase subunit F
VMQPATSSQPSANLEELRASAEGIAAKYERRQAAMLPVLHMVQDRLGFISDEAEIWVANFLGSSPAHVHEAVSFYSMFRQKPLGEFKIQACDNISCALNGSKKIINSLSQRLGIAPGEVTKDKRFSISLVECLCACEQAPVVAINDAFVGPFTEELVDKLPTDPDSLSHSQLPFRGSPGLVEPVISRRLSLKDPHLIQTYVRDEGYQAARKALSEMSPDSIISEVLKSNLRGLGGAGFPTGKKWSFLPKTSDKPKFLVVNCDEGEPGTFKDRYIVERDPHRLIEGMIIASFAVGANKAYIYIRGEYANPAKILQEAVDEAYKYGFLGKNIFNTNFNLDVVVHRGAGAYICGEESALLESLEGKKGFPRLRPPYPAISGLFACPTLINNVETLSCVPTIISKGAEWFASLGFNKAGGTRLFSISGHVNQPGLYEASHGVTLRELIFDYAGGIPNGRKLKAVIPGGISAKILRDSEIDVHMDFESLIQAGTMAGSGAVIVMDDSTCMVKALEYACKFFAHESCGQCSPCREGTGWIYKIIKRIASGKGRQQDLDVILSLANNMEGKTICVFADAAAWPVQSYIAKFRQEFVDHINGIKCNICQAQ